MVKHNKKNISTTPTHLILSTCDINHSNTALHNQYFQSLHEWMDGYDEEFELEFDEQMVEYNAYVKSHKNTLQEQFVIFKQRRQMYFRELFKMQAELVKLQNYVVKAKKKIVVLFEGRDAAGKGGVIKRITQRLNPRVCRVAALPVPNDREKTQWYFQRYVSHLPASGEIVLFDRSWYNRAGVERVMGFCDEEQYEEFFRSVPEFEKMLVRSGIQLIKYWFSISDEEQAVRFLSRINDPLKQWKLSPMDLESRRRWEDYTRAKEIMLDRTHIAEAPWWIVHADDKKKARLNCIHHLLQQIEYEEVTYPELILPERQRSDSYSRQTVPDTMMVPSVY